MASLSKVKSTADWIITFTLDGRRRIIHLGKVAKKTADKWRDHVGELVAAKLESRSPNPETSQ